MDIHIKGITTSTAFTTDMTPWDLYLVWRFSKEGKIVAKVNVTYGHLRHNVIDVSELDEVKTFTPEALDQFEDNYIERGILVW